MQAASGFRWLPAQPGGAWLPAAIIAIMPSTRLAVAFACCAAAAAQSGSAHASSCLCLAVPPRPCICLHRHPPCCCNCLLLACACCYPWLLIASARPRSCWLCNGSTQHRQLSGQQQRPQQPHTNLAVLLAVQGGPGKLGGPLALVEQRTALLLQEQELLQAGRGGQGVQASAAGMGLGCNLRRQLLQCSILLLSAVMRCCTPLHTPQQALLAAMPR